MNEDDLLDRLRAAASEADPPPEHVAAAARAAFTRASLEGELLELRFDSLVDADGGTRAGAGTRVLRFGTAECTAELEVTGAGPVAVVGQVSPAAVSGVELTSAGGVARADTDELGFFTFDGVAAGPASLAWRARDGRVVRTSWVGI